MGGFPISLWTIPSWMFLLFAFTAAASSGERVAFGRAVVVCDDPEVAAIGAGILEKGGTAVDAAVAVGFALAVKFPQAGNIGGGGFMLVWTPGEGASALDFREVAPLKARSDMFLDERGRIRPRASLDGYLAVAVPGTVAGLEAAHKRWGKLPWRELLEPAIRLAEHGFKPNSRLYLDLLHDRDRLLRDPEFRQIFYRDGRPKPWILQEELAKTLKRIAEEGAPGFYEGPVAAAIERAMAENGGLISREDLRRYRVRWRRPETFTLNRYRVIAMPLPSAGGWTLRNLFRTLEGYSRRAVGWHSHLHVSLVSEALKRAYAVRARWMGDPDSVPFPEEQIALPPPRPLEIVPTRKLFGAEGRETTHFSIVDRNGMAVSVTYTLNSRFGAGVIVPGTGIILNNEMDDFTLHPAVPNQFGLVGGEANAIAPGKRPVSSMTPTIVVKGRAVWGVLGSPGGSWIITTVYQLLENLILFGMTPEEAVRAGRFHHQGFPDVLFYERHALTADTVRLLKGLGYRLQPVAKMGRVSLIWRVEGGYLGIADSRGPGGAAAVRKEQGVADEEAEGQSSERGDQGEVRPGQDSNLGPAP